MLHCPPAHFGVPPVAPGQTWSHMPQFDVSVSVETQLSSQALVPPGQSMLHAPSAHTRPASHLTVQFPQCSASELVSTQVPSQSVRPVAHAMPQPSTVHTAVPFGGTGHSTSHMPQFSTSSSRRTQLPWQFE